MDALFAAVAEKPGPGAAVVVVQDGRIILQKGYGMANLEHQVPNTPQTKFRLGSVTKSFTATAILQLHEKGLLRIEDTIDKYLPDCPNADRITIRQLLSHTSGITGAKSTDKALEFPPGTRISYSNTGYTVLGRIIEKVCGKAYEVVLQENIFQPLGMMDTGYDHAGIVLRHRASGYTIGVDGNIVNAGYMDMAGPYAAGGLYSTVQDLARFDQALYGDSLLQAATLKEAFAPTALADGRTAPYGLGWMVHQYRGLHEVAHGGDITGFNSYLARFGEQRFTVIVLSNLSMRPPGAIPTAGDLAHRIADLYLADRLQPMPPARAVEVDPRILDAYVGQYRLTAPESILDVTGETLTVTCEAGRLFASGKQGKVDMVPASETTFRVPQSGAAITFIRDENGCADRMTITVMGLMELAATRVK